MSLDADALDGSELIQLRKGRKTNVFASAQDVANLNGLDGTEVVAIRTGAQPSQSRFAKTTTGAMAAMSGLDGAERLEVRQRKRHLRTTVAAVNALASGGGNSYHAGAVHFDGSQRLDLASLTCTDTQHMSFVGWIKTTWTVTDQVVFVVDSAGAYVTFFDLGTQDDGIASNFSWGNSDASARNAWYTTNPGLPYPSADGVWVCFIFSASSDAPSKGQFYLGDTEVTDTFVNPGLEPFTIVMNGKSIRFGNDTFSQPFIGDAADWRLFRTSILDGGGEIPLSTRRLFIDANGKPVDPAVATAALGDPLVLFSGDASTFATNQGTGGAFTLTGSLTNASTSPSD